MSGFSNELKQIRLLAGHKSAKSFYRWLKERGISFNYSYYMLIEAGELPSERVVHELIGVLKKDKAEQLILAYCRTLFPKNSYLFSETNHKEKIISSQHPAYVPGAQRELSVKQVIAIASNKITYHLFVLATLARGSISIQEIEQWYSRTEINKALEILHKINLIRLQDDTFEAISVEMRFPAADQDLLKKIYQQFDIWDEVFGEQFHLEKEINKLQLRRVSPRYISIIKNHLSVLFELVRSSDETDLKYNDKTILLKVVLMQGNLPG